MPYDELGNYVPGDEVPISEMKRELLEKSKTPQFIKNLEAFYQLLPGSVASRSTSQGVKPIAETAATIGSSLVAPFLGVTKGIGENILNNTNERVDRPELAEPFTYQPRTQVAQNYVENIMSALDSSKLPPYVAHAGQFRFTPDDLRVAGKTAVSDVRNFPMDFANARAGFQREYPTLGSKVAGAVERAEPLLEKGLTMYESGQLTPGFSPVSEAMKPKGGNWPTSLASTLPLEEQGRIGEYLGTSTVGPYKIWREQLREIGEENNWYQFLKTNNAEDIPLSDPRYPELAKQFTDLINNRAATVNQMAPGMDPLPTIKSPNELSKLTDAYNKWITEGPHKKYVTTQYGTGVETDPVLNAIDTANIDPFTRLLDRDATSDRKSMKRDVERLRERYDDALKYHERFPSSSDTFPDPAKTLFYPEETQFKNVGELTSRTPAGQKFENAQDYVLGDYSAFYHPNYAEEEIKTNFPVSTKLKIGTPVYDVLSADVLDRTGLKEIKQHVLDKVLSGEISPEKLPSVSVDSIVRDMIKTRTEALKKAQKSKELYLDWRKQNHQTIPADTEFTDVDGTPTGEKMVVFDADMANANPDLVIRNLSQDTKELNHCVGSCGHGTAEYPNRHVPMVEPHTGTTPRGSDASYGPNYIRKIKDGDIQIASLRGPNGESKATLELRPDRTNLDDHDRNNIIAMWLRQNAPDYVPQYVADKETHGRAFTMFHTAQQFPELQKVLADAEKASGKFQVAQIKGEGNGKLTPEAIEAVKLWLNSKGTLVKPNRISDLDNLPGIIDLRNERPQDIADTYNVIHPDKLSDFLNELVHKKVEQDLSIEHDYNRGILHPMEIINEIIPRFVSKDDLIKIAKDNGYDILRSQNDRGSKFTDLQKVVIESAVQDFHHGIDMGDLNDEYRANIETLLGASNSSYKLPEHVHMELARKLLDPEDNRSWIEKTLQDAHHGLIRTLSLAQQENMANIIQNWLRLHPFEETNIFDNPPQGWEAAD